MDTATSDDTPAKTKHRTEYSAVSQDAETEYLTNQQLAPDARGKTQTQRPDHRHSVYTRICTFWTNGWTSEVFSCSLAITALICLVVALSLFDGGLLTDMPLKISVNTLIAVFTAVIKSSLLLPVSESEYSLRMKSFSTTLIKNIGMSQLKWSWFSSTRALIDFDKFDLASRGPWGSLLLVFRLQSRYVDRKISRFNFAKYFQSPCGTRCMDYDPRPGHRSLHTADDSPRRLRPTVD